MFLACIVVVESMTYDHKISAVLASVLRAMAAKNSFVVKNIYYYRELVVPAFLYFFGHDLHMVYDNNT